MYMCGHVQAHVCKQALSAAFMAVWVDESVIVLVCMCGCMCVSDCKM